MKKILFLILCTLLISCQKKSEVSYSDEKVLITPTIAEILEVKAIGWKAGLLRSIDISKGIQLTFTFPKLENKDLRYLVDNYGVDGWVVKVRRKGLMKNETVGYLHVPIILPGQKNAMRINQVNKASFKVLYSAAVVSTRFSNLPCPAFKHNLLIKKMEVNKTETSSSRLRVSSLEEERLIVRVEDFNYSNTSLNGGNELRGEYTIEIAFYNKVRKTKLSNFITLNGTAIIVSEDSVSLSGCENFKIPPRMEEKDDSKKFKWNK
jgi:hypothetical protein